MPRLIRPPEWRHHLGGIDTYLTKRNDVAAARILRAILATADRLLEYSRIGREVQGTLGVLGVMTTPYLLLYRIARSTIEIVRIRSGQENWLHDPKVAP